MPACAGLCQPVPVRARNGHCRAESSLLSTLQEILGFVSFSPKPPFQDILKLYVSDKLSTARPPTPARSSLDLASLSLLLIDKTQGSQVEDVQQTSLFNNEEKLICPPIPQVFQTIGISWSPLID